MGENKVHYYWLDLVRFTAAFLVLICHFRGAFFVEYTLLPAEQKNPLIFRHVATDSEQQSGS